MKSPTALLRTALLRNTRKTVAVSSATPEVRASSSHPWWRTSAFFALPWLLWMASAPCSAQTVVIALYDYSGLTAAQAVRLTQTADRAFSHSGIHVVWLQCRGALALASERTCPREIEFSEIMVFLEPHGARSSHLDTMRCMGRASVSPVGGYSASVFVPAVREQAAGFGLAFELLMGYAVAHEVGHCLLGPGHSYVGLMRGLWDRKDAQQISQLSLHLTNQERRKAVARIAWLNQRP